MGAKSSTEGRLQTLAIDADALEYLDRGVIRVSLGGEIRYLNRQACKIVGLDDWGGHTLRDLLPDDRNYDKVMSNLARRPEGEGNQYLVTLTRVNSGRNIPVSVLAMPEVDRENRVVGSVAWFRPALRELAEEMHADIETKSSPEEILRAIAEKIKALIPFDLFTVSVYNAEFTHARRLFSSSPLPDSDILQRRWWPISPIAKKMLVKRMAQPIPDIDLWLAQPEQSRLRKDPGVRALQSLGLKSSLFLPLFRGDSVVASLLFLAREANFYNDFDRDLLGSLPLSKAVTMALYYLDKSDLEFRLDLLRTISSSNAVSQDVAQLMVDRIRSHYGWDNVSLFVVDGHATKIRLICQSAPDQGFRLEDNYSQDIGAGVLGYVAHSNEVVNIPDVDNSERYSDLFKREYQHSRSELCLPITMEESVRWLLNVEDHNVNAFCLKEQEALSTIANELAALLTKIQRYHVLGAMLESARDGVIRTDVNNYIREVNPAVERLLGYRKDEIEGRPIASITEDEQMGDSVAAATKVSGEEVRFRAKNGEPASMLLSAALLPEEVGGKVYLISDLSHRKSMERVEILDDMYYEIAMQTKPSLSLIASTVRRLIADSKDDERRSLWDVMRQLHKVENALSRLTMFQKASQAIPYIEARLSPRALVKDVLEQVPKAELDLVDAPKLEASLSDIRGDLYQISYVLESIVSYLLRFATRDGHVRLTGTELDGWIEFSVAGFVPEPDLASVSSYADARWVASTLVDMALGRRILEEFISKNNGRMSEVRGDGGATEFRISLPTWQ